MKIIILITISLFSILTFGQDSETDVLEKYYKKGMPIIDKTWTPEEYENAIEIIEQSKSDKSLELPTKEKTPKLFRKLTDFNDYIFFDSSTFNEADEMTSIVKTQTALVSLLKLYLKNIAFVDEKIQFSHELTAVEIAMLDVTDEQLELANRIIENSEELTEGQKNGWSQMKTGMNTFISGMLITISKDYKSFNDTDICQLANSFTIFYNKNKDFLDSSAMHEFDRKLSDISKSHSLECVTNATK